MPTRRYLYSAAVPASDRFTPSRRTPHERQAGRKNSAADADSDGHSTSQRACLVQRSGGRVTKLARYDDQAAH